MPEFTADQLDCVEGVKELRYVYKHIAVYTGLCIRGRPGQFLASPDLRA